MGKNNKKFTNEEVDRKLKEIHKGNIVRIDEYINARTPITFKCTKHNYEWKTSPQNIFYKGRGCPVCAGNVKLTNEDIDKRLGKRKIKRMSDYVALKEKMTFKCLRCNNTWSAIPGNVIRRNQPSGCPICITKREGMVLSFLQEFCPYETIKQHHYIYPSKDNKFGFKRLNVDFFIPEANMIIEYNGEQHYMPVAFGSLTEREAEKNFERQKERDETVRIYCRKRNINLVEIPYRFTDGKIKKVIKELFRGGHEQKES